MKNREFSARNNHSKTFGKAFENTDFFHERFINSLLLSGILVVSHFSDFEFFIPSYFDQICDMFCNFVIHNFTASISSLFINKFISDQILLKVYNNNILMALQSLI